MFLMKRIVKELKMVFLSFGIEETMNWTKWYLNGIEPRIPFTVEKEEDGCLPVLDVHFRRESSWLVTKVYMYRKETHIQSYLNWRSDHLKNCLLGIIKELVYRTHYFCDSKEDLLDEHDLLQDVFILNGSYELSNENN